MGPAHLPWGEGSVEVWWSLLIYQIGTLARVVVPFEGFFWAQRNLSPIWLGRNECLPKRNPRRTLWYYIAWIGCKALKRAEPMVEKKLGQIAPVSQAAAGGCAAGG